MENELTISIDIPQLVGELARKENMHPEIVRLVRNNSVNHKALQFTPPTAGLSPIIIYEEDVFELYKKSHSLLYALLHAKKYEPLPTVDTMFLERWDLVKKHVYPKLINYEWNKERLENMPYRKFLDFAIIYYIQLFVKGQPPVEIEVTDDHMIMWDISSTEIWINATNNMHWTSFHLDAVGSSILSLDTPMYNLSYACVGHNYGAVGMINTGAMQEIMDRIKGAAPGFFIIPSSIKGLFIIPGSICSHNMNIYARAWRDANSQYSRELQLSDDIYYYDAELGKVHIVNLPKPTASNACEAMGMDID